MTMAMTMAIEQERARDRRQATERAAARNLPMGCGQWATTDTFYCKSFQMLQVITTTSKAKNN